MCITENYILNDWILEVIVLHTRSCSQSVCVSECVSDCVSECVSE